MAAHNIIRPTRYYLDLVTFDLTWTEFNSNVYGIWSPCGYNKILAGAIFKNFRDELEDGPELDR